MKKLFLFAISAISIFVACNKKDYQAEDLDFKASIKIESPSTHYKNSPIPMKLIISNSNENVLNDVVVSFLEGDGDITVDEKKYQCGSDFIPKTFDGSAIPFSFKPNSAGEQSLKFIVRTSKFERSSSLQIMVEDVYYKVLIENMPEDPKVGRKESFDIVINFAEEEGSSATTCKATATITKGDGVIEYNGTPLSTSPVDMTLGRNTISYTAAISGKNIIQINLQAANGYVQPVYIPIEVGTPVFSLDIVKEDNLSITAGKDYSFTIEIKEDGLDPANKYSMTYRYIKNGGTIKINNKILEAGVLSGVNRGSNVINYNPLEGGDADIEFIVRDSYGTEQKVNSQFRVAYGKITVTAEKFQETITAHATSIIDVVINQVGYVGNYSLSCTLIAGEATLDWKNINYKMDGNWINDFSRSEVLKIKPTKVGTLQFRIKVKDSMGEISDPIIVTYQIIAPDPIEITTSGFPARAIASTKVPFKLKITAGDAEAFEAKFQITQGNGQALYVDPVWSDSSYGDELLSGFKVTPGNSFTLTAGEHTLYYYTSRTPGPNTFTITTSNGAVSKVHTMSIYSESR